MKKENEIKWVLDSEVTEEHPPNKSVSTTNLRGANEKPTVEELQSAVGGNIEVAFSDDDLRVQIIIDEEGKLKGKPMNMGATEHWYRLMQLDTNPDEFWTFEEFVTKVDFLVGDVVILHGGARLD